MAFLSGDSYAYASDKSAGLLTNQREILTGIRSFMVETYITGDTAQAGLTEESLTSAVESRLRNAGIRVLAENEFSPPSTDDPDYEIWCENWPMCFLAIRVDISSNNLVPLCAIATEIEVRQIIEIPRRIDNILAIATIWENSGADICGGATLQDSTMNRVKAYTDYFIIEYLAAN
jgi:hypothetical protein